MLARNAKRDFRINYLKLLQIQDCIKTLTIWPIFCIEPSKNDGGRTKKSYLIFLRFISIKGTYRQ